MKKKNDPFKGEVIIKKNLTKEEAKKVEEKYDLPKDWKEIRIKPKLFKVGEWNSLEEFTSKLMDQAVPKRLKLENTLPVYQEKFVADKKILDKIKNEKDITKIEKIIEKEKKKWKKASENRANKEMKSKGVKYGN